MITSRRLGALLAGALFVTACSGGDGESVTTDTEAVTTTAAPTTTVESTTTTAAPTTVAETTTTIPLPPVLRQPLTGEPLASEDEVIDRPALAVKIDNAPPSRQNHSGLANADIVYEEIVEGNITRFLAIFHSQGSDTVGPIRSGRQQDPPLVESLGLPLFAWSGGNAGVTRLIADSELIDLNAVRGGRGYYRGAGVAPHDLYNDTETLWAQTPEDHPGAPPQQFVYLRPEETFTGDPATVVDVSVGDIPIRWEWDAELGGYLRSQQGSEHVDVVNGPITATNVIVMGVVYGRSTIDANSPDAKTVGSGPVYVFSDGQVIQGEWARLTSTAPIEFFDLDGEPIALTPGNTWIELGRSPVPLTWPELD